MQVDEEFDEEDEIVAEIDVVLTQELIDQLYVMQYPLRPAWRGYDNSMLEEIRFKANQQILEMEYRLKEEEKSREQQTRISSATTGVEFEDPTKSMQTHSVRSSVVPNKSNYLVGLYRDSQLYVTPLKAVMQMRPSFSYIDQSAEAKAKRKEAETAEGMKMRASTGGAAAGGGGGDGNMESEVKAAPAAPEELKPLAFQVKKKESEKAAQNKLKSYQHLKQLEATDETLKLDFASRERPDSLATFERIAGRGERSPVPAPAMSPANFMMAINPPLAEDGSPLTPEQIAADLKEPRTRYAKLELADHKARRVIPNQVPPPISLHTIHQLDASEQIAHLFNNANVLTWPQILEYTSPSLHRDLEELAKTIQAHAVLIHGVWVVKTEKSYKHRAANVRNWVLMKIALADPDDESAWYISKQSVASLCGVSVELAATILDPITELVPKYGLKLKYAPDESFDNFQPNTASRYKSFWSRTAGDLERDMARWVAKPDSASAASASALSGPSAAAMSSRYAAVTKKGPVVFTQAEAQLKAKQRAEQRAIEEAAEAKAAAEAAAAENLLPSSSGGDGYTKSAATTASTSNKRENMDFSTSFNLNEALETGNVLSTVYVPISALAEEQFDKIIAAAFTAYGVVSPQGLVRFAKAKPSNATEILDVLTDSLAAQELSRKGSLQIKNVFVASSSDDDKLDTWRNIAIDFAKEKAQRNESFTRHDLMAKFRSQMAKEPPRSHYVRIISELFSTDNAGRMHIKKGDCSDSELRS